MACVVLDKLCADHARVQSQYAYFAYPQNQALRGTSGRVSEEMARGAKRKMTEITQRINWHQQECQECSGDLFQRTSKPNEE
jgi:hypothetical protein